MPPTLYRKGETIYDPETGEYHKIVNIKRLTIHGVLRTFYDLGTGVAFAPEARWREHHEVLSQKPTSAHYDI